MDEYFNNLLVMRILIKDPDSMIDNIERIEYYQNKYFNKNMIKEIKKIIENNDQTRLIGESYKEKLYEYLDFFRDLNTTMKKDDKNEIAKLINDSFKELNKIKVYEQDEFYKQELDKRTFGYYDNLDLVNNEKIKNKIDKSILLDLYYYEKLIGYRNDSKQVNFEYFMWSIGKFLNDYPEIFDNKKVCLKSYH